MKKSEMNDEQITEWIWNRCHWDGDCLLWDGAVAANAGPAVTSPYTGRTTPARRVLMQALGFRIAGRIATTTCGHPLCMAKEHLISMTRRELQKRSGAKLATNVVRKAKLAAATRARSYVNMEMVREIRASGLRATEAAARWGIPMQTAARILRHDSWKEYGSPFAGLGSRSAA